MPEINVRIYTVTQTLENGNFVSDVLFLPGTRFYSEASGRARAGAIALARRQLKSADSETIRGFPIPEAAEIFPVDVEMEPPQRSPAWEQPVALRFDALKWQHGAHEAVAYVPALEIAVLAQKPEELQKRVVSHIRFALFRMRFAGSLWKLLQVQRCVSTRLYADVITVKIRTVKQRVQRNTPDDDEQPDRVLRQVGTDLVKAWLPPAFGVDPVVRQVADALGGRKAGSVLLVGPSGVGKTAVVHELVRQRSALSLAGKPFWGTSGSRLVAGMGGFGMWEERCREICSEASKTGAILHVGGLVELMEVGKSIYNHIGIASFLRPYLLRGELVVIAECTPEQLPVIEREDPHLLEAFQQVEMREPSVPQGKDILLSVALTLGDTSRATISEKSLDLLDRLHRRYAAYSAYPGRPIRFLSNLFRDYAESPMIAPKDIAAAFSRETGMPLSIIDDETPLNLESTRQWFETQVMGQDEAVKIVVDLLAIIKTRLSRPRKPLASLLFIGPTGVGKTELAKALAEFLFGDRQRLVRFDMSEYADPRSVMRLIGGGAGAEGQLTSKVREQPFCVVLLDEFEKAHPDVFDTLLQVLGEGRLTDMQGRVADFSNVVIIMTSNLGAESQQKGGVGFTEDTDARNAAREHFLSAVRKFLRPEMFNRLDAVVPFAPLSRDIVGQIAARELDRVARRDGVRLRDVVLRMAPGVAVLLAEKGFDLRYGARPLKRRIERDVVAPLAGRLNSYSDKVKLTADVQTDGTAVGIDVCSRESDSGGKADTAALEQTCRDLALQCGRSRRQTRTVRICGSVAEIENEIYRLQQARRKVLKKMASGRSLSEDEREVNRRLSDLQDLMTSVENIEKRALSLEEEYLLAFYRGKEIVPSYFRQALELLAKDLDALLLSIYAMQFSHPDNVIVAVFGEEKNSLFRLAGAYYVLARARPDAKVRVIRWRSGPSPKDGKRTLLPEDVIEPDKYFEGAQDSVVGIVLSISARMAYALFAPEQGLHTFKKDKKTLKCLVQTSDVELEKYMPPPGVDRPGGLQSSQRRRLYNFEDAEMTDGFLDRTYPFNTVAPDFLKQPMEELLLREARALPGRQEEA